MGWFGWACLGLAVSVIATGIAIFIALWGDS